MAKKKKKVIIKFNTWDEASEAIKQIGELDRQINRHEAEMNNNINLIKANTEEKTKHLLEQKKELEKDLQLFTESKMDEFTDSKRKELVFGEVGFRKTTSIVTRNVKAIIGSLKQYGMKECIKTNITQSIDKEKLAAYTDEDIEKVGARRQVKDNFYYKVDEERIEKA